MVNIESARRFYEGHMAHISEVDVVPPKSGLPDHVGLEITVNSTDINSPLIRTVRESKDVVIALPLHE